MYIKKCQFNIAHYITYFKFFIIHFSLYFNSIQFPELYNFMTIETGIIDLHIHINRY